MLPIPIDSITLQPREIAKALGISQRTLWSLPAPRGPIPCLRVGSGKRRSVLFPVADLKAEFGEKWQTVWMKLPMADGPTRGTTSFAAVTGICTLSMGTVSERHAPQPVWIVATRRWWRQDLARWISGGCQPTCEQAIPSDPQKGELK